MLEALHGPVADMLCAVVMIVFGLILLIFRDRIGAFTGYTVGRGGRVDKPTPGWMLIPFAIALIIGGVVLVLRR